ncbi:MAG: protein kinase [Lentisphaeria bacterium]|nr:protein kinase [Lentisphaeria bacterium]
MDRYLLLEFLGQGVFTRSFLALDTVTESRVVLRCLPLELGQNKDACNQLRTALAACAHVRHPRINPLRHLHEAWELDDAARETTGVDEGAQVLVSDFVPGLQLDAWRKTFPRGMVPNPEAVQACAETAEALDALHGARIAHGSLQPSNVILGANGTVLLDSGIGAHLCASLAALGQPVDAYLQTPYRAPEQRQRGEFKRLSDQYALATLFCELVTGKLPIQCGDWESHLGQEGAAVLRRALSEHPNDRFSTSADFVQALAETPRPLPSPPISPSRGDHGAPAVAPTETPAPPPSADNLQSASAPQVGSEPPAADAKEELLLSDEKQEVGDEPLEGKKHPHLFDSGRALNIAITTGILLLFALCALLLFRRLSDKEEAPLPVPGEHTRKVISERHRLHSSYVETIHLTRDAMASGGGLRMRLFGQSRILAVTFDGSDVKISEQTNASKPRVLASASGGENALASGSTIQIAKTKGTLAAYLNGARVAMANCPLEFWRLSRWETQDGAPTPEKIAYQRVGQLLFADDFMHGKDEFGVWERPRGDWTVHALQNPIRSANPFSFLGQGEDALATAGEWFWRNYTVRVAAHPLSGSAFGLKTCWRDDDNTYETLWRKDEEGTAALTLSRLANGERTELARTNVHFPPNLWTVLRVSMLGGLITVEADGHEVIRTVDPNPLLGGRICLWSKGASGVVFDDLEVHGTDSVTLAPSAARVESTGARPTKTAPVWNEIGDITLANSLLDAELSAELDLNIPLRLSSRRAGPDSVVLELVRDGDSARATLFVERAGKKTELDQGRCPLPRAGDHVQLRALGSEVWVRVGSRIVAYTTKCPIVASGLSAFGAEPENTFRNVSLRPELPLPPIVNRVATFSHEASMQNWNSPVVEWVPLYTRRHPHGLYLHRSDIWQDAEVSIDVTALDSEVGRTPWGVGFLGENGKDGTPLEVLFSRSEDGKTLELAPSRGEKRTLPLVSEIRTLMLARRGNRLLAWFNGTLAWQLELPDELLGLCRVVRVGRGSTAAWAEAVRVCAAGVRTYSFKQAPSDWLPAAGEWRVTNRWQCDPRWSFFSGVRRHGTACLWNKRLHGDDVTIEFFAGPKMDQDRGRRYEYVANLNAVICADGKDISSGYSFLFGGWDDRGSQIVRGIRILAENRSVVIPRVSATHRRWFYVKLRKHGDQLSYWVDGVPVGSVRDPSPLTGRHFALWTQDNGMMIAQVRVSSVSDMPAPALATAPESNPGTPYGKSNK